MVMHRYTYERYDFKKRGMPVLLAKRTLIKNETLIAAHSHMNLEVLLILEGQVNIATNLKEYIGSKGSAFIINSNAIHSISSESKRATFYRLLIDNQFAQSKGFNVSSTHFETEAIGLDIDYIFHAIYDEFKHEHASSSETVGVLTHLLLIYLTRQCLEVGPKEKHRVPQKIETVQHAIEFINKYFKEDISLDDIVNELAISKSYYCRVFKELTKMTTQQYINEVRCKYAQQLLLSSPISIEQCALQSGFNSSTYFTNCYKNIFSYPPSMTRKKAMID